MDSSANERARDRALTFIKLLHTAVWFLFVVCIVALPVAGWLRRFDVAVLLAAAVFLECGVLAWNRGRCPLSAIAARFTEDRSPAFDIYLPNWLARWNKAVFGTLFAINGLILLLQWLSATGRLHL